MPWPVGPTTTKQGLQSPDPYVTSDNSCRGTTPLTSTTTAFSESRFRHYSQVNSTARWIAQSSPYQKMTRGRRNNVFCCFCVIAKRQRRCGDLPCRRLQFNAKAPIKHLRDLCDRGYRAISARDHSDVSRRLPICAQWMRWC